MNAFYFASTSWQFHSNFIPYVIHCSLCDMGKTTNLVKNVKFQSAVQTRHNPETKLPVWFHLCLTQHCRS